MDEPSFRTQFQGRSGAGASHGTKRVSSRVKPPHGERRPPSPGRGPGPDPDDAGAEHRSGTERSDNDNNDGVYFTAYVLCLSLNLEVGYAV